MTTVNVPGDYPTINAAVNAVPNNTTINVAPGSYAEIITIPPTKFLLKLRGAQAGVDARNRVGLPETIITAPAFPLPTIGTGIINVNSPDITIDGFTFSSSLATPVVGTAAIFSGIAGTFPPQATATDITGLQIINNRIISNANGIAIASTQPSSRTVNYLIQNNYFNNNTGISGSNVLIGNSIPNSQEMTNALVTKNLFDGLGLVAVGGSSINLAHCATSTISYNVINNDNSIVVQDRCQNITITYNYIDSVVDGSNGIFIFDRNNNVQITNNSIINPPSSTGINITQQNQNIMLNTNCITGLSSSSTSTGILISTANNSVSLNNVTTSNNTVGIRIAGTGSPAGANMGIMINNCNINELTSFGIVINPLSYQIGSLIDATNNWWADASGPNYNNTAIPGTGSTILDLNNSPATSITFSPFRTTLNPVPCPPPVFLTKSVIPASIFLGSPIVYDISITIPSSEPFTFNSFFDTLPVAGNNWTILSQNPPNIFVITGPIGSQTLSLVDLSTTTPGIYTVRVSATSNTIGQIDNTVSANITYGTTTTTISASATVQVLPCIHRTSNIRLADGTTQPIEKLRPGTEIIAADRSVVKIIEAVECLVTTPDGKCGTCIVFEPDSLGPGVPAARFGVDAGHPINIPSDYETDHILRPAKEFLNGTTIYDRKWDSVTDLFDGHTARYDIIMPSDSCCAYFANNIVVKSRQNFCEPGYNYL